MGSFPSNWNGDASRKLQVIADRTLRQAKSCPGEWLAPLPELRSKVRFVRGCAFNPEPHFEIVWEAMAHMNGGLYCRFEEDAPKTLKTTIWCGEIYDHMSWEAAEAVVERIRVM